MFALKAMKAFSRTGLCRTCLRESRFSVASLALPHQYVPFVLRPFSTYNGYNSEVESKKDEHLVDKKMRNLPLDFNMMSTGEACELLRSRVLSYSEVRLRVPDYG